MSTNQELIEQLKKNLVFFTSRTRSFQTYELVVTERRILDRVLKDHRNMGRSVYLSEGKCDRKRCDVWETRGCVPCIKDYWQNH